MALFPLPYGRNFGNPPLGSGLFLTPQEQQDANGYAPNTPFSLGSGLYGQPPVSQMGLMGQQTAADQQQGPSFDDRLNSMINSPAFVLGMSLLSGANSKEPWAPVLQNTLAAAANQAKIKREQQAMELANREFAMKQEAQPVALDLQRAQTGNINAETELHGAQARMAQQQQDNINQWIARMSGGGAPAQGGSVVPVGGGQMGGQAPASAPVGYNGIPPGVDPEAVIADLAFNQGKGIAGMYAEAKKAIPGANGVIYHNAPNGLQVDPASMAAYATLQNIEKSTGAQYDLAKVPYGQQEVTMPRSQALAATSGNASIPGNGGIPNNNYGNIRPVGATQGFQSFASPEQGLAAIDKQLQIYGNQHGVNTLAGVISRWAPATENDTAALIANASKRLGLDPNQKIDLNNPATRQAIGTAILLQEQGGKIFAPPQQQQSQPRMGVTAPPQETPEGILKAAQAQETQARTEQAVAQTAQTQQNTKQEQAKVSETQANDTLAYKNAANDLSNMKQVAQDLLNHKGLEYNTGITGAVGLQRLFPGSAPADATAKLNQLKSQVMVNALASLKSASKNGSSGFGQLSDREGAILESYISNLDKAQSYDQMKSALSNIVKFAQGSQNRLAERYNTLYGNPASPNVAPSIGPRTVGSSNVSPPLGSQQPSAGIKFLGFE